MAHLFRLALALLCCFAGSAGAVITPSTQESQTTQGATSPWFPLTTSACEWLKASLESSNPNYSRTFLGVIGPDTPLSSTFCRIKATEVSTGNDGGTQDFTVSIRGTAPSCPANSSVSGGACVCSSGYVESAGACVPPPDQCVALKGQSAGDFTHDSGFDEVKKRPLYGDFTACDSSLPVGQRLCQISVTNPSCALNGGGWFQCTGAGTFTGIKNSSADGCVTSKPFGEPSAPPVVPPPPVPNPDPNVPTPDPTKAPPAPCPTGQQPGTVNGTTSCYPSGVDGSRAGTSESGVKNPDGSSSSTTNSTACQSKDKCVTDSTTCNTPAGGGTPSCSTTTTTGSLGSVCAQDKGNTVCTGTGGGTGTGGSFTGDCAAGFRATGEDAIANAMALEQHKRNCKFFDSVPADTPESLSYAEMKAKAGTDQTGDMPADSKRTVTISGADFDSTSLINSSMCIQDLAISVVGVSVSLPISKVCPFLDYLGTIMVVIAWIVAARIVFVR